MPPNSRRPFVRAPYPYPPESCRSSTVPGPHHLLRLAFAAVRGSTERPLLARADGVHGIPELRGDSAVGRVLQQAHPLAVLDLPTDLSAELEVVALVVNRPGSVGLHENAVIGGRDQLLQCQRVCAGQNADV